MTNPTPQQKGLLSRLLGLSPHGRYEARPLLSAVAGGLIAWGTAIAGIAVVDLIGRQILLEDVRTFLARTAAGTAALIDGDQLRKFTSPRQDGSPEYNRASLPLRALLETNPDIRFAYVGVIQNGVMHFILDGTKQGTFDEAGRPNHSPPMEVDEASPGRTKVSRTHLLTVEKEPTATAWGMGIRAHAPVFARNGEMIGLRGHHRARRPISGAGPASRRIGHARRLDRGRAGVPQRRSDLAGTGGSAARHDRAGATPRMS